MSERVTTDSRGERGEDCRYCETPWSDCTARILGELGRACCSTCQRTDTHNAHTHRAERSQHRRRVAAFSALRERILDEINGKSSLLAAEHLATVIFDEFGVAYAELLVAALEEES